MVDIHQALITLFTRRVIDADTATEMHIVSVPAIGCFFSILTMHWYSNTGNRLLILVKLHRTFATTGNMCTNLYERTFPYWYANKLHWSHERARATVKIASTHDKTAWFIHALRFASEYARVASLIWYQYTVCKSDATPFMHANRMEIKYKSLPYIRIVWVYIGNIRDRVCVRVIWR